MQEANQADVLIEARDGGVLTLTLNRPAQFNALSVELIAALEAALERAAADETIDCVVIAGAGRAFCAGHDLRQMRQTPDRAAYEALFARCSKLMQAIGSHPVPVIARVHGIATAAGCQLVAACDLAVAASDATFAVSGINVGLFCSTPAVALSRNVGPKRAFDMLATGRFVSADEALQIGLLSRVASPEMLDAVLDEMTAAIEAKSRRAIRLGKAMFQRQRALPVAEAYELAGAAMAENMMFPDAVEGIDAFLQKRTPTFRE